MEVEKFIIQKSVGKPWLFILIAITKDGKAFVVAGDDVEAKYLKPFEGKIDSEEKEHSPF